MTRVTDLRLRRIYDSRGLETVEATIVGEDGAVGVAGAPSGASTGIHEVRAFPPGGVTEALATFARLLRPRLTGADLDDQATFDGLLHAVDGTANFAHVGGNTATALSVAFALAGARSHGETLARRLARPGVRLTEFPAIVGNCMNGGRHAIGGPEIQEFIAFSPAANPSDSVATALQVHHRIGEALRAKFPTLALGRGDEGGWVAPLSSLEALEILSAACTHVTDATGIPVHPGLDLAASEFYHDGQYRYRDRTLDDEGQLEFVTTLVERFGLRYVEDPFQQEDFESFARLTSSIGSRALVVGDDLYTTALGRVKRGADCKATNAVLIKVNQVGTLTDTLATVDFARDHAMESVTSHRSGEVPEGWLAHLALANGSAGLKCGLLGGERVAKLNELLSLGAATGAP
ncbi:MAG: phosphopyruvate hydratase [Thermoplasmata archaeon]